MSKIETGLHYPLPVDELPESWVVSYVGDFATDIEPGFASGEHNKKGAGIPHLRPMNIDRLGKIDLTTLKYVAPSKHSKRLHVGDVLFNNTNSPELVGKTTVITQEVDWAFSNHMTRIVFPERIFPKFAAYQLHYLWMSGYFLYKCVKHVNQASVASNVLENSVPFIVAPVSEQERIVDEIEKQFSRLDEAVVSLKRAKANLRRYKAAVLKAAVEGKLTEQWRKEHLDVEPASKLLERILTERRRRWEEAELVKNKAVGKKPKDDKWKGKYPEPDPPQSVEIELPKNWVMATVKQLTKKVQYGTSSKATEESVGIPVLRMSNISEGELSFDDLKYLPRGHDEFPDLLLEPNDLLFNRTNSPELVGKTTVYAGKPRPCSFASYLIRVRFLPGIEPKFVSYYINSVYGRRWIKSVVSQQVGQANVNGTKLQALSFPLPPYEEQQEIVSKVESRFSIIKDVEKEADTNLRRAEHLRQSILKKAFTGRLVMRRE